jgi:hypothetical protein
MKYKVSRYIYQEYLLPEAAYRVTNVRALQKSLTDDESSTLNLVTCQGTFYGRSTPLQVSLRKVGKLRKLVHPASMYTHVCRQDSLD